MLTTSFGYHTVEDRIWMGHGESTSRIWITRRLAIYIIGTLARQVEQTAPGVITGSVKVADHVRAELEHGMALDEAPDLQAETPTNQPPPKALRVGTEQVPQEEINNTKLCKSIKSSLYKNGRCKIEFELVGGDLHTIDFTRSGLHRWLRAFQMILNNARWDLPVTPPPWLTQSLLPASVQRLLEAPLPDSLDGE